MDVLVAIFHPSSIRRESITIIILPTQTVNAHIVASFGLSSEAVNTIVTTIMIDTTHVVTQNNRWLKGRWYIASIAIIADIGNNTSLFLTSLLLSNGSKTRSMYFTGTNLTQRINMKSCPIPLIITKTIQRKHFMVFHHHSIPLYFSYDRS